MQGYPHKNLMDLNSMENKVAGWHSFHSGSNIARDMQCAGNP
jgi:hypothetical protein